MSQSGWSQPTWGPPAGPPVTLPVAPPGPPGAPGAPAPVWHTPQPPYVWPFGQGPDYAAGAPALTGWGAPQTHWLPPRPRRRPLPYVIVSLAILLVLVFGGLAVVSTINGNGLVYRNDSYTPPEPNGNPPPLPRPPSTAAADQLTQRNPLYDQRVPAPIRCSIGSLVPGATNDELAARANQLTACLMRAWEDPVREAGDDLYRPTVTVFSAKIDSACGDLDIDNAFYCATDQQIYLGTGLVEEFADTPLVVDMILAHEFGHLVQARTGILLSARSIQQDAASTDRLRINRRVELQADCFAGLWMHAVTRSMKWGSSEKTTFVDAVNSAGDRPDRAGDHGKGTSREYWLQQGLGTNDIGTCNTFTATDNRVE